MGRHAGAVHSAVRRRSSVCPTAGFMRRSGPRQATQELLPLWASIPCGMRGSIHCRSKESSCRPGALGCAQRRKQRARSHFAARCSGTSENGCSGHANSSDRQHSPGCSSSWWKRWHTSGSTWILRHTVGSKHHACHGVSATRVHQEAAGTAGAACASPRRAAPLPARAGRGHATQGTTPRCVSQPSILQSGKQLPVARLSAGSSCESIAVARSSDREWKPDILSGAANC